MQLLQKILKNDTIVKEFIKPLLDILLDNGGLHGFDCVVDIWFLIYLFKFQLFVRNPKERMGMPDCLAGPIRMQPFFRNIDWEKLERRMVDPPFKPTIVSINY
jgi:hypothetical protein